MTHVRLWRSVPIQSRRPGSRLWHERGYVYLGVQLPTHGIQLSLLEPPPPGTYKIGHTDRDLKKRRRELWKTQRVNIIQHYVTFVSIALEGALHAHFEKFRVKKEGDIPKGARKNEAGERFRLPTEEAEAFEQTVKRIERRVLAREEAQLQLDIMQIEARLSWEQE